jgi:hypothetical protein
VNVVEPTVAQRTLEHRLADLPESAFSHIKMGYVLLKKLDQDKLTAVVEYVASNFSKRSRYDPDMAAKLSGVDKNIVGDLLSAVALTVGSVFDIDVSKEDFFNYAPKGLILDEVKPVVGEIIDAALERKESLNQDFEQAKSANAVLPSYRFIEHAIDVRLNFAADGSIVRKVPLAVFYLATDSEDQVWFQTSEADLDDLISKLNKARDDMRSACSAIGGWK